MSGPNGQSIAQRLDPARVRQLEQERQQAAIMLLQRAVGDVSGLLNSLAVLRDNAAVGNQQAQQLLKAWADGLSRTGAAAAGIVISSTPPAEGT